MSNENQKADVSELDSNALLDLLVGAYVGEKCQGCKKTFETIEELKTAVWWPWEEGRAAHKECYQKYKSNKNVE